MGIKRQRLVVLALVVAALALSACGGGSSHTSSTGSTPATTTTTSADRTKLLAQLQANIHSSETTVSGVSDLEHCILQAAGKMPLSQLRVVASPNVASSVTDPLVAHCVSLGKGLPFVRQQIANVVASKLPAPIPKTFTKCVVSAVDGLTAAELARAINSSSTGDQAYARAVGQRLALACIRRPAVFASWRRVWLDGVRRSLRQGRQLTPAFRQCVYRKASRIQPDQLITIIRGGLTAQTGYGRHLGELCRGAR